jgi:hypothetical protein
VRIRNERLAPLILRQRLKKVDDLVQLPRIHDINFSTDPPRRRQSLIFTISMFDHICDATLKWRIRRKEVGCENEVACENARFGFAREDVYG